MGRSTNPDDLPQAGTLVKRLIACHQNALETFPIFASAVLICRMRKVKPMAVNKLAVEFLFWRVLFTLFYALGVNDGVAALRTLSWVMASLSNARLYYAAM